MAKSSPWCGHCKALAPEYAKAAQKLLKDDSPIHLGKVDATVETSLGDRFSIAGYPSLKLFMASKPDSPIDYTGGRTADSIIEWLKRKTGPVSLFINEISDFEKVISDNDIVVVFFGTERDDRFKRFSNIGLEFDDLTFANTNVQDIMNKFEGKEGKVVIFKNIENAKIEIKSDSWTDEELREFINQHQYPTVMPFNEKYAEKIFTGSLATVFLIRGNTDLDQRAETAFRQCANSIKNIITLSIANIDDHMGSRLAEYLELTENDLPVIRIIDSEQKNYLFNGEYTSEAIQAYVEEFNQGKLKPYYKSEEIPEENNGPVKIVVGKTFKDIVLNENNDVLIEVYAPWCVHCKHLESIFEAVAKRVSHIKNLIIAKIDGTANDIEDIELEGFPTILFYPKNSKNDPLPYEGDRDEDSIIEFLREYSTVSWDNDGQQQQQQGGGKTPDELQFGQVRLVYECSFHE